MRYIIQEWVEKSFNRQIPICRRIRKFEFGEVYYGVQIVGKARC